MKKIIFIINVCISLIINAQPYGTVNYPYPNGVRLQSVFHSLPNTNEGFVMGSSVFQTSTGNLNFSIDRTSPGGEILGNPWEFQREYFTSGSSSCNSVGSQILDLAGVSVIQTTVAGSNMEYAVCGANSLGVFFCELNGSGVPIFTIFWQYPTGPNTTAYRPQIIESTINPGTYFIAGSYGNNGSSVYALHITSAGTILSQIGYNVTPGIWVNDIIESPYSGNELVMVGSLNSLSGTFTDALIFSFNQTLTSFGTINNSFDRNSQNDHYYSIEPASCAIGGVGFIVGGYSEGSNIVQGKSFVQKLTPAGTNIWSSIIEGTTYPTQGRVKKVLERKNLAANWEYYALSEVANGMVVYKLDDSGNPFGVTYPGNPDEFAYGNTGMQAIDMTSNSNLLRPDVGLHIFGSDFIPSGNHQFIESYFNGDAGCNSTFNYTNIDNTISTGGSYSFALNSGLSTCAGFAITSSPVVYYAPACGPAVSLPGGSNARLTAVSENKSYTDIAFSYSGKATTSEVAFRFTPQNTNRLLVVFSLDGREIIHQNLEPNTKTARISDINLCPGIYIAKLSASGSESIIKFAVQDN